MNTKDDLETFNKIQKKTVTTSEILQSSFSNVFERLKVEDYLIVENTRRKEYLVIQPLNKYLSGNVGVVIPSTSFTGKVSSRDENVSLARTYIKENVYYLMKFESSNITFPQVETIIEKGKLSKEYDFDVMLTNNLMDAWKYVLYSDNVVSLDYLLHLHALIAKNQALEWGKLRSGKVTVSGTSYAPDVPTNDIVTGLINLKDVSYRSVASMVVRMIKAQLFWDGNKRTSILFANKILIDNSMGILAIQDKDFYEFNTLLNDYYNNESCINKLVDFMVSKCFYNTLGKELAK